MNIGDKVTIISKMIENMFDYVSEMKKYAGKEAKIKHIIHDGERCRYFLDIDNEVWSWYKEYFK